MRKRAVEELTAEIDERLTGVRDELSHVREEVVRKLERLDAWLITHDPSTRVAAEAYDGLRRQLSAGAKARRLHLVDLAKLDLLVRTFEARIEEDPAISAKDLLDSLRAHASEWASDAGLEAIVTLTNETLAQFEVLDETDDGQPNTGHVLKPAYVDQSDGVPILIRRGTARLFHDPSMARTSTGSVGPSSVERVDVPEADAAEGLSVARDEAEGQSGRSPEPATEPQGKGIGDETGSLPSDDEEGQAS